MKCHKCNHISFDHLSQCRKCGVDLSETREALGFAAFNPSAPFLLGSLLGKLEQTQVERADDSGSGEASEDFAVIDMEDGFDLLNVDDSDAYGTGREDRLASGRTKEPIESSMFSPAGRQDAGSDEVISFVQDSEDLDLSLSFEVDDDLSSNGDWIIQEEEPLSGLEVGEKSHADSGDTEKPVLEGLEEELRMEGQEAPSSPGSTQHGQAREKSRKAQGDALDAEQVSIPSEAKDREVLEFELEEIDLDALFLEGEEAETSQSKQSSGVSKKKARAGTSRRK